MAQAKKKVQAKKAAPEIGDLVTNDMLGEMDHQSLILFARLNYGMNNLSVKSTPKGEVIELIMNAARKFKGNQEMMVVAENSTVEVPPGYVKIRVSPGLYNPNNRPIVIGLNFKMATIPVNEDIIMPVKYLPCLQDAVRTTYFLDRSGPEETLGMKDEHSYPFSILERG